MEFAGSANWGKDGWQVAAIWLCTLLYPSAPGGNSRNKVMPQDAQEGFRRYQTKHKMCSPLLKSAQDISESEISPTCSRKENAPSNMQETVGVCVFSASLLQHSSASYHFFDSGGCDWCSLTSTFSSSRACG